MRAEQDSSDTDVPAIPARREKIRADLDTVNRRIDALVTAISGGQPPPLRKLERA